MCFGVCLGYCFRLTFAKKENAPREPVGKHAPKGASGIPYIITFEFKVNILIFEVSMKTPQSPWHSPQLLHNPQ